MSNSKEFFWLQKRSEPTRLSFLVLAFFVLSSVVGCSGSDIDKVKSGVLNFDKSTTVGKAIDGCSFFKNVKWSSGIDKQGRKFVFFDAEFNGEIVEKFGESVKYYIDNYLKYNKEAEKWIDCVSTILYESKFRIVYHQEFVLAGETFTHGYSNIVIHDSSRGKLVDMPIDDMLPVIYANEISVPYVFQHVAAAMVGSIKQAADKCTETAPSPISQPTPVPQTPTVTAPAAQVSTPPASTLQQPTPQPGTTNRQTSEQSSTAPQAASATSSSPSSKPVETPSAQPAPDAQPSPTQPVPSQSSDAQPTNTQSPPTSAQSQDSLRSFVEKFFSVTDATGLSILQNSYADTVNFYGKEMSNSGIMKEKLAFFKKWPSETVTLKSYDVQDTDDKNIKQVSCMVEFHAQNDSRTVGGLSMYTLGVRTSGNVPAIVKETAKVIQRY